jgi:hypothetical protein
MNAVNFINTSLQRGAPMNGERENRFNGFSRPAETVQTVSAAWLPLNTPLKRGVNGSGRFNA